MTSVAKRSQMGGRMSKSRQDRSPIIAVAGNGLLDRRALLGRGIVLAGAIGTGAAGTLNGAAAEPLAEAPWSREPGEVTPFYGHPSRFEKSVVRTVDNPKNEPSGSRARTPHHLLKGTITPNGLHFTIMHSGIPDIDPAQHKLLIHGMVRQPLVFDLDALARYRMVTRVGFMECGGNSAPLFSNEPIQADVQALHGLASCAEWAGVPWRRCSMKRASSPAPNGSSPKAPTPRICRAAFRWQRSSMTPWSRSTRTASASSRARAIRCGSICRATKAT
jgi:hypothetical protein